MMFSSKITRNISQKSNPMATIFTHARESQTARKSFASRLSIVREFALNTSAHAIPGIARGRSKYNKIFWSASFIIFTLIMIYFIVDSVITYFQYPTQTVVSILIERSDKFPAVTICNFSPARWDTTMLSFSNFTIFQNLSNGTLNAELDEKIARYLHDYLVSMINGGHPIDHIFYKLDVMLISCVYNGKICTVNDFISFTSPNYGSCYTFNAKTKNSSSNPIRRTNDNGAWGRLQLKLYAHTHLYLPYLNEGSRSNPRKLLLNF